MVNADRVVGALGVSSTQHENSLGQGISHEQEMI